MSDSLDDSDFEVYVICRYGEDALVKFSDGRYKNDNVYADHIVWEACDSYRRERIRQIRRDTEIIERLKNMASSSEAARAAQQAEIERLRVTLQEWAEARSHCIKCCEAGDGSSLEAFTRLGKAEMALQSLAHSKGGE